MPTVRETLRIRRREKAKRLNDLTRMLVDDLVFAMRRRSDAPRIQAPSIDRSLPGVTTGMMTRGRTTLLGIFRVRHKIAPGAERVSRPIQKTDRPKR